MTRHLSDGVVWGQFGVRMIHIPVVAHYSRSLLSLLSIGEEDLWQLSLARLLLTLARTLCNNAGRCAFKVRKRALQQHVYGLNGNTSTHAQNYHQVFERLRRKNCYITFCPVDSSGGPSMDSSLRDDSRSS